MKIKLYHIMHASLPLSVRPDGVQGERAQWAGCKACGAMAWQRVVDVLAWAGGGVVCTWLAAQRTGLGDRVHVRESELLPNVLPATRSSVGETTEHSQK